MAVQRGDNKKVKTLRLVVDPTDLGSSAAEQALSCAARILRAGGLVALPTETVYGLGANALDAQAVGRIFAAKQRPSWDPIIVHIADLDMLQGLVEEVPEAARRLMEVCWPGPLTLLLRRTSAVPDAVTAGRPLVGVRMPAHPVALQLIRRAGVPIAAPSANTFGHISPTSAAHVLEDLDGRIDAVLDAGPTEHGVESTVLDPGQTPLIIYRPGAVTALQIEKTAGPVEIYRPRGPLRQAAAQAPGQMSTRRAALPSPGVGLRHYAPKARLVLVEGALDELGGRLAAEAANWPGERVGLLLPADMEPSFAPVASFAWGRWAAPREMARDLYAGLHALDAAGCTVILAPLPRPEGIGAALRDRLRKAAYEKQGPGTDLIPNP
jgi:L-threonylcarbamoyladenylate synthase